jgi:hypothetical protein
MGSEGNEPDIAVPRADRPHSDRDLHLCGLSFRPMDQSDRFELERRMAMQQDGWNPDGLQQE